MFTRPIFELNNGTVLVKVVHRNILDTPRAKGDFGYQGKVLVPVNTPHEVIIAAAKKQWGIKTKNGTWAVESTS